MIEISLSKLKLNTFFTFCLRVKELLLSKITPEMGIDFYVNAFTASFDKLNEAMGKSVVSAAELARQDSLRDQMWVALRTHVKNYLRHPELAAKAQVLLNEIDKKGTSIYRLAYAEETSIIKNVCNTLEAGYSDDLTAIHADVWFTLTKNANAAFENAMRAYNAEKTADSDVDAASTIRPELEVVARKLLAFLPMQAEVNGNEALQSLVKELEIEASRF